MAPTSTPNLHGRLSATSLGEWLALALDRKLSGSLVLEPPAQERSILVVEAGRVTKVRTAKPVEPLGQLLVATGALDGASLDAALLLARQQRSHLGQTLLTLRLVGAEVLDQSLGEQLARRVAWLGRLPLASSFGYYANADLLAGTPASNVEPLALLWRAIRDAPQAHPRQEPWLMSVSRSRLRLSPGAALQRFAFSTEERGLVDALREQPESLPGLLSGCALDEERARRLVYVLLLTHQLLLGTQAPPGEHSPSSTPAAAPSQSRVVQALERATRRARSQRGPEMTAEAERAFRAACSCVSRKQLAEAERFARVALEIEPGNPEYLALHAWLRMHGGGFSTPAEAMQIVAALDRAVMKARESVTIRFYRAQVLKRLGRDEDAFKDFRFVARREPNHLDAVREVRLHLMRMRDKQKVSGVFSRLFLR